MPQWRGKNQRAEGHRGLKKFNVDGMPAAHFHDFVFICDTKPQSASQADLLHDFSIVCLACPRSAPPTAPEEEALGLLELVAAEARGRPAPLRDCISALTSFLRFASFFRSLSCFLL